MNEPDERALRLATERERVFLTLPSESSIMLRFLGQVLIAHESALVHSAAGDRCNHKTEGHAAVLGLPPERSVQRQSGHWDGSRGQVLERHEPSQVGP